ncbi:hypothetical protein VTO73DRAFT_2442 [Trametes versicolor]
MASATKKALWLCTFLAEVLGSLDHLLAAGTFILGFPMALAKNDRTKHMAVADVLRKALPREKHGKFLDEMMGSV